MKRSLINSISLGTVLLIGVLSCKEMDLTFDQQNAFVAFQDASGSIPENSTETFVLELYYASTTTGNVSVTLGFDVTEIDNPALEGVDFNVKSSKTVSFENNIIQLVQIETIDNDIRDKNKSVKITLTGDGNTPIGMGGGTNGTYLLTIVDNEHPLAIWIGNYTVAADSYGDVLNGEADGAWDEEWEVTISPVDGDETVLEMVGIAYGEEPVLVSIDLDEMTVTFPSGSNTGVGYGYGPALIWKGNYETVENEDVVGNIHPDGTMDVDELTLILPDYGNFVWDSFNTTWTPSTKKAAPSVPFRINKMNR